MYVIRTQAVFAALTAALATPCFAQSSTAPASDEVALEEIVITGSRLASGFATPTPVTMVAADDLTAAVPNNMGESLAQLPSLAGSIQNTTSGIGSGVGQNNGQNLLNLRRLGSDRTLILLDGQRLGVTNVVGSVDINIIPQNIVKRVDVVTGGASASYGSEAVAGAVNFILDTTFEGLKLDINGGITDKSDAENGKVSIGFGKQLSDRARVVGAAEFFKLNGIKYGEVTGRDWFDHPTTSVPGGAGRPNWMLIPDARSRIGTYGGTILAPAGCSTAACSALANQQFLSGGVVAPFQLGANDFTQAANWTTGGDGAIANQPFTPNTERYSMFLHGEFDVSDNLTVWAQGGYNLSETFLQAQVLQVQGAAQWTIFEDNAYLPASINSIFAADTGAAESFRLTRYNRDMGFNEVTGNVEVMRFAAGLKGDINDRWSYDGTVTLQDTHQDLDIRTAIVRNMYAAADAVVHPTTGQIVCRSQWYNTAGVFVPTGTGMDPGCVPANLFGDGSVSQAATNYIMGLNTADVDLKQTTVDLNIRGDFGDNITLGAGPISFAAGANYRKLTADRVVDPLSAIFKDGTGVRGFPTAQQGSPGGYSYYNPTPFSGDVDATEGYVEFGVPLLAGLPMVQELTTTMAGRLTDYSQSGVENMWKLGLNWTMNDSVRFRSTLSADTRAPNVIELFDTGQVVRANFTVPGSSPTRGYLGGQFATTGYDALEPERARTYTAGFVLAPLPSLQLSIDWYRIDLLGAIGNPGQQEVVDGCAAGDPLFCSWIQINGQTATPASIRTVTSAADFVQMSSKNQNEPADQSVAGIDVEAAYKTAVGAGDLTLRLTANYALKDYDASSGCAVGAAGRTTDFVGAIGNCGINPKIRGRISANYDIGSFGIYVQERYIDKGKRNPNYVTGIDISDNDIPAYWYTDLTLSYALGSWRGGDGEVYLNVTNVFDKEPPATNSTAGRSWIEPTETELYDALGRRYVLGVRYKW